MPNQEKDPSGTWYAVSELFAISSAAVLALCIGTLTREWWGWLAGLSLFLLGVAVQLRGDTLKSRLETTVDQEEHRVTRRRLETLKAVGVEDDILETLDQRINLPPLRTREFTAWLEQELGEERAQEKLDLVLRYTKLPPTRKAEAAG
jgi:hypothetical protein